MATLALSMRTIAMLAEWHESQTGRKMAIQATLRPDGLYDLPVEPKTAARFERFRAWRKRRCADLAHGRLAGRPQ